MAGKGENPASFVKHEEIARLAKMQAARALNFLKPGDRAVIIDMHAGDGRGVEQPQGDLFWGSESTPTARLAIEVARVLRTRGIIVDVFLCECSRDRRRSLVPFAGNATILRNHRKLPPLGVYAWGLVFNDPNGPSRHGVDVMQRLANEVSRLDFIVVVNEGACGRVAGVRGSSNDNKAPIWSRTPERAEAVKARYVWMTDSSQWARNLNRRHVLRSQSLYGRRAMKGRILLVTNAPPQRAQRNFISVAILDTAARTQRPSEKSTSGAVRRRNRDNSLGAGGFRF